MAETDGPGYNCVMADDEVDFTTRPEAFAKANEKATAEYLRCLDLETAAIHLEHALRLAYEFFEAGKAMGLPPALPNPLPGPTLAILLEGETSEE